MWALIVLSWAGWFSFIFTASSAIRGAWSLGTGSPLWNDLIAPQRSSLRWLIWGLSTYAVCVTLAVAMLDGWWLGVLIGLALHAGMLWLNIAAVKRHLVTDAQVP